MASLKLSLACRDLRHEQEIRSLILSCPDVTITQDAPLAVVDITALDGKHAYPESTNNQRVVLLIDGGSDLITRPWATNVKNLLAVTTSQNLVALLEHMKNDEDLSRIACSIIPAKKMTAVHEIANTETSDSVASQQQDTAVADPPFLGFIRDHEWVSKEEQDKCGAQSYSYSFADANRPSIVLLVSMLLAATYPDLTVTIKDETVRTRFGLFIGTRVKTSGSGDIVISMHAKRLEISSSVRLDQPVLRTIEKFLR